MIIGIGENLYHVEWMGREAYGPTTERLEWYAEWVIDVYRQAYIDLKTELLTGINNI